MLIRLVALLALMSFASACSEPSARDQARKQWDDRSDGDFVLSFEADCACPAAGLKFDVKFRNDNPISASYTRGDRDREVTRLALELVPTVDELLTLADQEGEFDEETGLPAEARRGDVTYQNIRVTFDLEAKQATAEAARLVWEDRDFNDYRLNYRCVRGCGERGRIKVEWREGDLLGDADTAAPTSVEELLALIDEALASSPDSAVIRVGEDGQIRRATIVHAELGTLLDVRGVNIEPTAVP